MTAPGPTAAPASARARAREAPLDHQRLRMRFLAQSAAQIAAGFTANPETSGQDCRRIARDSFAIAQAILDLADEWLAENSDPAATEA
jgi:hypothetical protein